MKHLISISEILKFPYSKQCLTFVFTVSSFFFLSSVRFFAQCVKGDCKEGIGTKLYPDSSIFTGTFKDGKKTSGTYKYRSGDTYIGTFKDNLRDGIATYNYANGDIFYGFYEEDNKVFGTYRYVNGDIYEGTFDNNLPNGHGTITTSNGKVVHGEWTNGKLNWNIENLDTTKSFNNENKEFLLKSPSPRMYVVVVGIADYEGSSIDLNYSDNDAIQIYNHFNSAFPKEISAGKSVLLLNQKATTNNIKQSITDIFKLAGENDYVLFYFSGHGSPGRFISYDYNSGTLEYDFVKNAFKDCKAKYKVCIADACFSGGINQASGVNSAGYQNIAGLREKRLAVFMSSKPNQTSIETSELKQGVFSYYLIQGMRGNADFNKDSYITVAELFVYTKQKVMDKSQKQQIPIIIGQNLDKMPMARLKKK
jgi:hypothetical protein